MPSENFRIGVPSVYLSYDDDTVAVPILNTMSFLACAVTVSDSYLNDVKRKLSATDTYQVAIGLVGRDLVHGGYTVGRTTPSSGNITITAGQGIKVSVVNTDWPANFAADIGVPGAICAAIFLKTNSGNFQLAQFAYVSPTDDFTATIIAKPMRVAPAFTMAVLNSTSSDTAGILGSRAGFAVSYGELTPTTGNFDETFLVTTVPISTNTGPDFTVAISRANSIRFQTLSNGIKELVQAAAGNYVKYTHGGVTIEEGQGGLATAQAIFKGNKPLLLVYPVDTDGFQESKLLIGNLTVNQQQLALTWSKSAPTAVQWQFDPASLDKLITNQHTVISYKRFALID